MSALAELVDVLADARRCGIDFDTAWTEAREVELATVHTRREREGWAEALDATADAWRRAYNGEPLTARERTIVAVVRYRELEPAERSRFAVVA